MNSKRHFYAGINHYGINVSHDSDGWAVYRFTTETGRDDWLEMNGRNVDTGNIVAEAITAREARHILTNWRFDDYFHRFPEYDN